MEGGEGEDAVDERGQQLDRRRGQRGLKDDKRATHPHAAALGPAKYDLGESQYAGELCHREVQTTVLMMPMHWADTVMQSRTLQTR